MHPSVTERLARLAPDQRAAATAPPGPVLCVAPAGSGKTTTLVARVAYLVDSGVDAASVCLVAFNKKAAEELTERLDAALAPLGVASGTVRVRTFHALGREVLRDAGVSVDPLISRDELVRDLFPGISRADRGRLDLAFSRLKLDLRVSPEEILARDPAPGPVAQAYVRYVRAVRDSGGVDFDDFVIRALDVLGADPRLLARWRARTATLMVDEAQDLDRTQLDLALLLAGDAANVMFVGDDDQSIYAWRLADVRRVLGLAALLPGLRRVDLSTNYRCPPPVVERAVRLVEVNQERFAKRILAGSRGGGRIILAPDAADDPVRIQRALAALPPDGATRAVLSRTNRELLSAVVAAVELRLPFRAPDLGLVVDDPRLDGLMAEARAAAQPGVHALITLGALRQRVGAAADGGTEALPGRVGVVPGTTADGATKEDGTSQAEASAVGAAPGDDGPTPADLVTAMIGWAASHPTVDGLEQAVAERRALLAELRRDDAPLTLATAHGTKGLEWDHVIVLADGFPGRRSISDAAEPERAMEEERRLAYVAWTRARRSLTLLYSPDAVSPFLREAFSPLELGAGDEEAAA